MNELRYQVRIRLSQQLSSARYGRWKAVDLGHVILMNDLNNFHSNIFKKYIHFKKRGNNWSPVVLRFCFFHILLYFIMYRGSLCWYLGENIPFHARSYIESTVFLGALWTQCIQSAPIKAVDLGHSFSTLLPVPLTLDQACTKALFVGNSNMQSL